MSEDISKLVIQVQSESVAEADKRMEHMSGSADKAKHSTEGLVSAAHHLVAEYLSVRAAFEAGKIALENVIDATKESEAAQAKLRATTGASKADAHEMFLALDELEGKAAVPIQELTDAFTLLASRGLDPSKAALEAYLDVAAGTGTSIGAVAESIAQAANGMFRGLNQLGIRATQEMDGLALTFRGTTTKIKGDAASIEQYVQGLAKSKFLGAAETQADSLSGSIFRLKDAWGDMWRAVSETGAGDAVHKVIKLITDDLHELTDMIASGQLQGYLDAIFHKFDGVFTDIHESLHVLSNLFRDSFGYDAKQGQQAANFIEDAFLNMPENIRAAMGLLGATFGLVWEAAAAAGRLVYDAFTGYFKLLITDAGNVAREIKDQLLHPFSKGEFDFLAAEKANIANFTKSLSDSWDETTQHVNLATDAWRDEVVTILDTRDAAAQRFKALISAADELRKKYEDVKAAKAASNEDPLKKGQQHRGTDTASEAQRAAFEQLKASLQIEERVIQDSYDKRIALIRNMTKEGDKERVELEKKLDAESASAFEEVSAKRLDDVLKLEDDLRQAEAEGNLTKMDALRAQLQQEEAAMAESYEFRRQLILNSTTLTEEQRQKKLTELAGKATDQQRRIEVARNQATLSQAADFFGNISKIAGAFGEKGARIAKAAAIIQATIKTYESATSAYAALAGIPYVGPALGAAAAGAAIAAGLANVAAIKSQNYSGAYATGGYIPPGSFGLVGETGVGEFVHGPAVVTSARATADQRGVARGGNVTFNVINQAFPDVEVSQGSSRDTEDGKVIDIIVKKVKASLTGEVNTGGSSFTKSLERRYRLNRGGAV